MVIKYLNFYIFFIFLFFCKNVFSSQIYDFQTEKFIQKINLEILSVNEYNKKINFIIYNDKFPNAFITQDNILYISSGLLIYTPDYISLLTVLAHEIGHLEKHHIRKREKEIRNLKNINSFGSFAVIAGSMLMQRPELINALTINQTTMNNLYINFSQEQEREADLYAAETLNNLNLSANSSKEFFKILEAKTKVFLIDKELKKFSTHPPFDERIDILEINNESNINYFDQNLQNEFNFIKAKFIAYTNSDEAYNLIDDEKIYYNAIKYSLAGDLPKSLKNINILISKHKNNYFLIETKADILLSYGYNKEAIQFYYKVLENYPENNYVKFNIFLNSDFEKNNEVNLNDIFSEYKVLISLFPYNQILLTKYYELSKNLKYSNWILFFEILLFEKNNMKQRLIQLSDNTEDYNLKKIIKIYI